MAEAAKEPAPKRSPLVLVLSLVSVVALAGSGAAVYLVVARPAAAEAPATSEEARPEIGPLVELTPMVVNLDEQDASRLLRVVFQLELENEADRAVLEQRLVPLRSDMLLHLSSLRVDDVQGRENRERLLEALRTRMVPILGEGVVRRVYFGELVVQ